MIFLFAIFKSSALETFHKLDSETSTIAVAIILEKIDLKLCDILLYHENAKMSILLSSFPRKPDRNIATSYDCNRNLHNIKKELMI